MSDPVQADAGALAALKRLATEARDALNADAQTLGLENARAALLSKVGLKLCGDYLRACNPDVILALVQDAERYREALERIAFMGTDVAPGMDAETSYHLTANDCIRIAARALKAATDA